MPGSASEPMDDSAAQMRRTRYARAWLLIPVLAIVELSSFFLVRAAVPTDSDWEAAASFVRAHHRKRDQIVVAPTWADPILRQVLGDELSLADAGYGDLAPYERVWAQCGRHREEPELDSTPTRNATHADLSFSQ